MYEYGNYEIKAINKFIWILKKLLKYASEFGKIFLLSKQNIHSDFLQFFKTIITDH